jgi:hypothetical protein
MILITRDEHTERDTDTDRTRSPAAPQPHGTERVRDRTTQKPMTRRPDAKPPTLY